MKESMAQQMRVMKKEENYSGGSGQRVKSEHGVAVKSEGGVKAEDGAGGGDEDCVIDRIDYSKKIPDFSSVPTEVVKSELSNNGLRTCSINKAKTRELITLIWQYRKHGELPERFIFEDSEVFD